MPFGTTRLPDKPEVSADAANQYVVISSGAVSLIEGLQFHDITMDGDVVISFGYPNNVSESED